MRASVRARVRHDVATTHAPAARRAAAVERDRAINWSPSKIRLLVDYDKRRRPIEGKSDVGAAGDHVSEARVSGSAAGR